MKIKGFISGFLLGLLFLPAAGWLWLYTGHMPVAVTDPRLPYERRIADVALKLRLAKEAPIAPALEASTFNLLTGARLYRSRCANCHGLYGRPAADATYMYPSAPQLWQPHTNHAVGVSDDPVGQTWWKIKNGLRHSGMPAYQKQLNSTEIWQISVLLKSADGPLPTPVMEILSAPQGADPGLVQGGH